MVVVIVDTVVITAVVVVAAVFATGQDHQQEEYLFYHLVRLGISYAIFRQVAYNIVFPAVYYTKDRGLIWQDARRLE